MHDRDLEDVLLCHVGLDASVAGTVFKSMSFSQALANLRDYLDRLTRDGREVPVGYQTLLDDMQYLIKKEMELRRIMNENGLTSFVQGVVKDLMSLTTGKLYLPGGWVVEDSGHAMIYEFGVNPSGLYFKVINSGSGLNFHFKKSGLEKNLYKSSKSWRFPKPKKLFELEAFIGRLFRANIPMFATKDQRPIGPEILYKEIFSTISYIQGEEIDEPDKLEHTNIPGQLSGTCAQRCLHAMLKELSPSLEAYQRFIFGFKEDYLYKYLGPYLRPSNAKQLSVVKAILIDLSIENLLKILNIKGLFSPEFVEKKLTDLGQLQEKIRAIKLEEPVINPPSSLNLSWSVRENPAVVCDLFNNPGASLKNIGLKKAQVLDANKPIMDFCQVFDRIKTSSNQWEQLVCLQSLMFQFPLQGMSLKNGFYNELTNAEDLSRFYNRLNAVQDLLLDILANLFEHEEATLLKSMLLITLHLKVEAYEVILANRSFPSFRAFSSSVMARILNNNEGNPFIGTKNPLCDQKIAELFAHYGDVTKALPVQAYNDYFKALLNCSPESSRRLADLYRQKFNGNNDPDHEEVRKANFEVLYMIVYADKLLPKGSLQEPSVLIVSDHASFEKDFRRGINPFFTTPVSPTFLISLDENPSFMYINTGLHPTHVPFLPTKAFGPPRQVLNTSPPLLALLADVSKMGREFPLTANRIQLTHGSGVRDFFHLRANPRFQVFLTIGYYRRHPELLSDKAHQCYVEANLFQPDLLSKASRDSQFFDAFDDLLKTGCRFHYQNGLHTDRSLFFVRLDFLVSRYIGEKERLEGIVVALEKQLLLKNSAEIRYALQEFLFLTLIALIDIEGISDEHFNKAYHAYFYLNRHTNGHLFEATDQPIEVAMAEATFKMLIQEQSGMDFCVLITELLRSCHQDIHVSGHFPNYKVEIKSQQRPCHFDVLTGQFFDENGFKQSGMPLEIRNHPLVQYLGLGDVRTCKMSSNGKFFSIPWGTDEHYYIYINTKNDLTVQKDWFIDDKLMRFELQSLTPSHLGSKKAIVSNILPILKDGRWEFWKNTSRDQAGLLVCDGQPRYLLNGVIFWVLDSKGNKTGEQLVSDVPRIFRCFEGQEFTRMHRTPHRSVVYCPRYSLCFEGGANGFIWPETGEKILDTKPPIHPVVACLVLDSNGQQRCLVPVARFYATDAMDPLSGFYATVHDKSNRIAEDCLDEHRKKKSQPGPEALWDFEGSQSFYFYPLEEGKPRANNVLAGLYLAYIYLATNQPEKAWETLEDCNTRLGGITEAPEALQFISWICNAVPYQPSTLKSKETKRQTPPYVACQLKALSLLAGALIQGANFNLKISSKEKTANKLYETIQVKEQQEFLSALPKRIYELFTLYQTMGRYLADRYRLSFFERKCLFRMMNLSKIPMSFGALGVEWMQISLESILKERDFLQAMHTPQILADRQQKWLAFIEKQLKAIEPVRAESTALMLVEIDLTLPESAAINDAKLSVDEKKALDRCDQQLLVTVDPKTNVSAMSSLSSRIELIEFLKHFPVYFQIALKKTDDDQLKALDRFCMALLIAERHTPFAKHRSPMPILCRVLYGLCHNKPSKSRLAKELLGAEKKMSALIGLVRHWPVPPLKVYEAKHQLSHVLATPAEWMANRRRPQAHSICLPSTANSSLIVQTGISHLLSKKYPDIAQAFITLESNYVGAYKNEPCTRATQPSIPKDEMEYKAGQSIDAVKKQQQALALALLGNDSHIDAIIFAAQEVYLPLREAVRDRWSRALALANQGPSDPDLARSWKIERRVHTRKIFTPVDLSRFYINADLAYIVEQTGLGIEDAQHLFNLIHEALLQEILIETTKKVSLELKAAKANRNVHLAIKALDMLFRSIPGLDNPLMMMVQYNANILLREEQVHAFQLFAKIGAPDSAHFVLAKLPPGIGKSTVIIPSLVGQHTNGHNLLMVLVPPALLETNRVDLSRTLQQWFGKKVDCFKFNRYSDVSVQRLQQIYQHLIEVITSRDCFVSTVEMIQSLELKYLELLLLTKPRGEIWSQQVFWFDKIISLFHHQAEFIIDEVHQGLSIEKKLNYIVGESIPLDPLIIKNAIALFGFISTEFIKAAPFFDETYDWRAFKLQLARELIFEYKSPLSSFVAKVTRLHGPGIKQDLIHYLTNDGVEVPNVIQSASDDEKATFAFLKQQVRVTLQETLSQKLNVDYGPSKLPGRDETLAIPYAGNGVPNETSLIGNPLVSVNKTIQMMLLQGITIERLIIKIKEWQAIARQEFLRSSELQSIDSTPTAKGFDCLLPDFGFKLSEINTNNQEQILELHERLRFNRQLISNLLETQALPLIKYDGSILSSDGFNVVSQAHDVFAMSGTPANPIHYHPDFKNDRPLGNNGYILQVIKDKKPRISVVPFESLSAFIENVLSNLTAGGLTRAIVDISARFAGKSHHEVAKAIALYIRANPRQFNASLKHVLYFNNEQVLCAIKINQPDSPPMILGSSDQKELDRLLGSTPEERFTYYDQIHTTGTDIAQYDLAHFILMVDDKVFLESFLQGAMRARKLAESQTIEFVVNTGLQGKTLDNLLEIFEKNDRKNRSRDVFFAAKGQMKNHIRRFLLSMIETIPPDNAIEKARLADHMKPFFIDTPSRDLFALYGGVNQKKPLIPSLYEYQMELMDQLTRCFQAAGINSPGKVVTILRALEEIITRVGRDNFDSTQEDLHPEPQNVEFQVEQETHLEVELSQIDAQKQRISSNLVIWDKKMESDFLTYMQQSNPSKAIGIHDLSAAFAKSPGFSNHFYLSLNYIKTYWDQIEMIDSFLKPVLMVWYHLADGELYATIVTPQETNSLMTCIDSCPTSWVSTTEDILLAGKRPDGILIDPHYQSLREQILFFKGDFRQLLDQTSPFVWMKDDPNGKIQFFKNHLAAYRPGSIPDLDLFESALAGSEIEGFKYMQASPWGEHVQCPWKTLFPKASDRQQIEYQKFANALTHLKEHWGTEEFGMEGLQQSFELSVSSLVYLVSHVDHLKQLKGIFDRLKNCLPVEQFLMNLSNSEILALETVLGMSRSQFYELSDYRSVEPPEPSLDNTQQIVWCQIAMDVVTRLRRYPAFKDQRLFEQYFQRVASQVPFPEILQWLMNNVDPTPLLIKNILNNPICDSLLRVQILEKNSRMEPSDFDVIVQKAQSMAEFDRIVAHANFDSNAIDWLLDKPLLQESHLQSLQAAANSSAQLMKIIGHHNATASLANEIVSHRFISPEILSLLIDKFSFTDGELLSMLGTSPCINLPILTKLLVHKGDKITPALMKRVITHHAFSIDMLIGTINGEDTPFKHMPTSLFDLYKSDKSAAVKDRILELICKSSENEAAFQAMKKLIQGNLHWMPSEFKQQILAIRSFDRSPFLPAAEIIKIATTEQLRALIASGIVLSNEDCIEIVNRSPDLLTSLLTKRHIPDNQLIWFFYRCHNEHISKIIDEILKFRGGNITEPLLKVMIDSRYFSTNQAQTCLDKVSLGPEQLRHLAEKMFSSYEIKKHVDQESCLCNIFLKSTQQPNALSALKALIREKITIINPEFWQKILKLIPNGFDVRDAFPVLDLLRLLNSQQLLDFIRSEHVCDLTMVNQLATHIEDAASINALLAHPQTTPSIAAILFKKKNYDGTIGDWPWLTKELVLTAMEKVSDFQRFNGLLHHRLLSKADRQEWFDGLKRAQTQKEPQAAASGDVQEKLMVVLNRLKIKAVSHALKAMDDKNYINVAQTATDLYFTLKKEVTTLFSQAREAAANKTCVGNCQRAILQAEPVLKKHRGYKQLLLDLLNVLFCFLLIPPAYSFYKTGQWRFFRADTASVKITKSIDQAIMSIKI